MANKTDRIIGKVTKGSMGEYHTHGGQLDDGIFFLKPNRHGLYGVETYKKVGIKFGGMIGYMLVDECNPIDSLMIDCSRN